MGGSQSSQLGEEGAEHVLVGDWRSTGGIVHLLLEVIVHHQYKTADRIVQLLDFIICG